MDCVVWMMVQAAHCRSRFVAAPSSIRNEGKIIHFCNLFFVDVLAVNHKFAAHASQQRAYPFGPSPRPVPPAQSEFPCFEYMGDAALTTFKKRLMLGAKDSDVARRARRMVNKANAHLGTRLYDQFQLCTNGILP